MKENETKRVSRPDKKRVKKVGDVVYYDNVYDQGPNKPKYIKATIVEVLEKPDKFYPTSLHEAYRMDNGDVLDWTCCHTYSQELVLLDRSELPTTEVAGF